MQKCFCERTVESGARAGDNQLISSWITVSMEPLFWQLCCCFWHAVPIQKVLSLICNEQNRNGTGMEPEWNPIRNGWNQNITGTESNS